MVIALHTDCRTFFQVAHVRHTDHRIRSLTPVAVKLMVEEPVALVEMNIQAVLVELAEWA